MSRYARLLKHDHNDSPSDQPAVASDPPPSPSKRFSGMFQNLKESAGASARNLGGSMNKAASAVGLPTTNSQDSDESNVLDEVSELCPKLTFQQRVMGFAICFVSGYLVTFGSFKLFVKLVEGNPAPFVFVYSFGNILSLMSSMFLCGPQKQFKNMFDESRRITSVVYLSSLGSSIAICFIPIPTGPRIGLLVILLFVQMMASLWYTLSYIPYGRATARRFLTSSLGTDGE